jgi:type IV pilus assembly protein PilB
VSTLPTQFGESVVLRILDRSAVQLDLDKLGVPESVKKTLREMIQLPNGIIIVTGPTGSGKTTTLYACLREINEPNAKLLTAEDPVEYDIDGIMQVPVNEGIGLDFSRCLRAFLRQDPDRILVGETRDLETAQIAIQASLTGHLVFTSLHTNDSISSVGRLVDMGAEPFLIASVLEGMLAQRLGRRLCKECVTRIPMTEEMAARITPEERLLFKDGAAVGKGCEKCNGSGFRGRMGFYELARINARLREGISKNRTTLELREMVDKDFQSMRDDGMHKAAAGLTTIDEVLRATQDIDDA